MTQSYIWHLKFYVPTFQKSPVNVFILRFGQRRIFVEHIGHEGEVEFGVSTDDVSRGDKLSTAEPVGLLQHGLCPLHVVSLLYNTRTIASHQTHCAAVTMWRRRSDCQSTYPEAFHVNVYAWLIFLCAFWRDLIQEMEIGPWVLENNTNKQEQLKYF